MKTNEQFSDGTLKVMLEKIEQEIAALNGRLQEYQKARREILAQLEGGNDSPEPHARLPRGLPAKLVEQALRKYGRITMAQLRLKIKEDTGRDVKDASARRALENMMERGLVRKTENAEYELMKGGVLEVG